MVIGRSFDVAHAAVKPPGFDFWQRARAKSLNLFQDVAGKAGGLSKRLKILMELQRYDNGNPETESIVSWLIGGTNINRSVVLHHVITLYMKLFGEGFAVPLLYRWKHAEKAKLFVTDWYIVHKAYVS
jgi:hypothetical protein